MTGAVIEALTLKVDPQVVAIVRIFFDGHPYEGFILAYVAECCGLDAVPTMSALCVLLEQGEIEVEVGHHTWVWQFSKKRRGRA